MELSLKSESHYIHCTANEPVFRNIAVVTNHDIISGSTASKALIEQKTIAHQLSVLPKITTYDDVNTSTTFEANLSTSVNVTQTDDAAMVSFSLASLSTRKGRNKAGKEDLHPCVDQKRLLHLRSTEIEMIVAHFLETVAVEKAHFSCLGDNNLSTQVETIRCKDQENCHKLVINRGASLSIKVPPTTFLVVTGPTGSGKTKLIQYALQDRTIQRGGYYIRGTFDVLQHPDPYRAFCIAFTDFTYQVLHRGPDTIAYMQSVIVSACGRETNVLTQMIPALSAIIDFKNDSFDSMTDKYVLSNESTDRDDDETVANCAREATTKSNDAIQRFVFAFHNFIRAISSPQNPIVFVLDDIQYADDCSVDMICSIVKNLRNISGLFIIGAYNGIDLDPESLTSDNVIDSETKVRSYFVEHVREMERISNAGIKVQTLPIKLLELEQIKHVLKEIPQQLSMESDSYLDFVTLVLNKTNGNLFLIFEFLRWIANKHLSSTSRNGVLTCNIDDTTRRIKCHKDEEGEIDSASIYYVCNRFQTLPVRVVEVLKIASCFGSSNLEDSLIGIVLGYPVGAFISYAKELGILVAIREKQFSFVHEIMQTAAYNLILKSKRESIHLEIGRRLWWQLDSTELDRYIFVVLSHMHIGRRLIILPSEKYAIAGLCLDAARKAAKLSTFRISLIYLKFGIELIGDSGWTDCYDLSMALYNAAAEMEVNRANFERVESIVALIKLQAQSTDDTIQPRITQLYAYGINDRQHDALDLAMQILFDLGCRFPRDLSMRTLSRELTSVLSLLKGKSNEYLKRLPVVEDNRILACLHVLSMMFLHTVLARPSLFPFITLKAMKLTLTHGLSFMSPQAFSAFGMLCVHLFPTPDNAFRYGELSLELLDKYEVREYLPITYAGYYSCISIWKNPVHESLDYLIHAYRVGIQTGHFEVGCLCAHVWMYHAIETDIPLDEIEIQAMEFQATMKSNRQQSIFNLSTTRVQAVQFFQGKDVDFTETDALLEYCVANDITQTTVEISWWRAQIYLLFNDFNNAYKYAQIGEFSKNSRFHPPSSEMVHIPFINGMIALALAGDITNSHWLRWRYVREAKKMMRFMKKYVSWAPSNYVDKQLLLEAEFAAFKGNSEQAMTKYNSAIVASKRSRNMWVLGLANERAGRYCYVKLKQQEIAKLYFKTALSVYRDWKAHRKVDYLCEEMITLFGDA